VQSDLPVLHINIKDTAESRTLHGNLELAICQGEFVFMQLRIIQLIAIDPPGAQTGCHSECNEESLSNRTLNDPSQARTRPAPQGSLHKPIGMTTKQDVIPNAMRNPCETEP
jgi:hypothetical protein